MDRLWTPWRFAYVSNLGHSDQGCAFCEILSGECDQKNLVLYRGKKVFIVLNLYPYTSGHLLLVANRHIPSLQDADPEELHSFLELARVCERALGSEYHPDGLNIGFNIGRAAGAGVDHHLHMHVLPRWVGDSSFMTVVGETRVLPEALGQTYNRLAPYFENLSV
jgi:ATP adenylyltransferase